MTRLYRFESVVPLGNGIFRARDPLTELPVTILQWTPEPETFPVAKDAFQKLENTGGSERFSDGVSLFIAADGADSARNALVLGRAAGLFSGDWPGLIDKPLETHAEIPSLPAGAAEPDDKAALLGRWKVFSACIGAVAGALVLVTVLLLAERNALQLENRTASHGAERIAAELKQERTTLEQTRQDLESVRSSSNNKENEAAGALDTLFSVCFRQTESTKPVRLTNSCANKKLWASITFRLPGTDYWATRGWWKIEPDETVQLGSYPSDSALYLYAHADDGSFWDGPAEADSRQIEVVDPRFFHLDREPSFGSNKLKVRALRAFLPTPCRRSRA